MLMGTIVNQIVRLECLQLLLLMSAFVTMLVFLMYPVGKNVVRLRYIIIRLAFIIITVPASQCNGVTTRIDLNGNHTNPYVAWSYISAAGVDGYAGQCCCKNTLQGLVKDSSSIMGLANCPGEGRLV